MKLNSSVATFLFLLVNSAFAQLASHHTFSNLSPASYLFPIQSAKEISLAGSMGEFRNSHIHAGIDIRTDQKIGLPVLAVEFGYISAASISSKDYGISLQIKHLDGNTSWYAHLSNFCGALKKFVILEQYRLKKNEIQFIFKPNQFQVKRGDTIAFSGNTGFSRGPHLHYEIRSSNNEILNPLHFFPTIEDKVAPVAKRLGISPMSLSTRINNQFGRQEFVLLKDIQKPRTYRCILPIKVTGKIGIELDALDQFKHNGFTCGVSYYELKMDNKKVYSIYLNRISTEGSMNLSNWINYKVAKTTGKKFLKFYKEKANSLIPSDSSNIGFITPTISM